MVMMYLMVMVMMMQVIDCYPRPTEPESSEALDTLESESSQFLPNYLSG